MRRFEPVAVLLAVVLAAAACAGDDGDGAESGLGAIETPTFAEEDASDAPETTEDAADVSGSPPLHDATDVTEPAVTTTAAERATPSSTSATTTSEPVESVSFDDPVGDATPGVGAGTPPAWSDLAGATMERRGDTYQLRIRLGGTRAPSRSEGDDTMNIATFYDVDGDGSIDREIWVNLDGSGWGAATFDDHGGRFGEETAVTVTVDGDAVVLTFPVSTLGAPDRFRFALASEYGELATMGSDFARRDDAPDENRSVAFPG